MDPQSVKKGTGPAAELLKSLRAHAAVLRALVSVVDSMGLPEEKTSTIVDRVADYLVAAPDEDAPVPSSRLRVRHAHARARLAGRLGARRVDADAGQGLAAADSSTSFCRWVAARWVVEWEKTRLAGRHRIERPEAGLL